MNASSGNQHFSVSQKGIISFKSNRIAMCPLLPVFRAVGSDIPYAPASLLAHSHRVTLQ
jgi:hypothetical protein